MWDAGKKKEALRHKGASLSQIHPNVIQFRSMPIGSPDQHINIDDIGIYDMYIHVCICIYEKANLTCTMSGHPAIE